MSENTKDQRFAHTVELLAALPEMMRDDDLELSDRKRQAMLWLVKHVHESLEEGYPIQLRTLVDCFKALERPDLVIRTYEEMDKTRMLKHHEMHHMSQLLLNEGRFEEAAGFLERMRFNQPKDLAAHAGLSHVYYCLGRYDEAREAATQALRIAPNNPVALSNYGEILFHDGFQKEGLDYLECALAIVEKDIAEGNFKTYSEDQAHALADDIEDQIADAKDNAQWVRQQPVSATLQRAP